jgi:hypothetical protein
MIQNDKPRVIVKTKNLALVFDYCIESKTPFTANPRLNGDEWEIEFKVTDVMGGVVLGMFLRENRMEPVGVQVLKPQTSTVVNKTKPVRTKKQETAEILDMGTAETAEGTPISQNLTETVAEPEPMVRKSGMVKEEKEAPAAAVPSGGFSPEMLFDEN